MESAVPACSTGIHKQGQQQRGQHGNDDVTIGLHSRLIRPTNAGHSGVRKDNGVTHSGLKEDVPSLHNGLRKEDNGHNDLQMGHNEDVTLLHNGLRKGLNEDIRHSGFRKGQSEDNKVIHSGLKTGDNEDVTSLHNGLRKGLHEDIGHSGLQKDHNDDVSLRSGLNGVDVKGSNVNVHQYAGQNLIKQNTGQQKQQQFQQPVPDIRSQAVALTGIPLINFNTFKPPPQQLVLLQRQQQQQQMAFMIAYSYQQQILAQQQQQQYTQPPPSAPFVPRVLRPRRRRKGQRSSTPMASTTELNNNNDEEFEIGLDEESHFLPTDLLMDNIGQRSSSDGSSNHSSDSEGNNNRHLSPIRPPSRQKTPIRHTESLRACPPGREPLRKTCSWAEEQQGGGGGFSLFPKTSQSDLLCSVRNDLRMGNNNVEAEPTVRTIELEDALKNMSVDEGSLSRKF